MSALLSASLLSCLFIVLLVVGDEMEESMKGLQFVFFNILKYFLFFILIYYNHWKNTNFIF